MSEFRRRMMAYVASRKDGVYVPTPDCYYDFSLGSNTAADRETVKDLSGNGKNAKIYNSAFNEDGSGYKDGALFTDGVDD